MRCVSVEIQTKMCEVTMGGLTKLSRTAEETSAPCRGWYCRVPPAKRALKKTSWGLHARPPKMQSFGTSAARAERSLHGWA